MIAIENNKPAAVARMDEALTKLSADKISVRPLTVKYPQGAEKMLIEALTGQEYVMTALPADVGCIILNVRTIYQIYMAVAEGIPATKRIVTVTGDAVAHPRNIEVPLGTSVRELIDFCGGFKEQPVKILSGGPMMGISMRSIDVPVVKGTSGILDVYKRQVTERQHCDFLCVAGSEGKDYCAAYLLVCMTGINAQTNMEFEAFIKFRGRAFLCERYCL